LNSSQLNWATLLFTDYSVCNEVNAVAVLADAAQ